MLALASSQNIALFVLLVFALAVAANLIGILYEAMQSRAYLNRGETKSSADGLSEDAASGIDDHS